MNQKLLLFSIFTIFNFKVSAQSFELVKDVTTGNPLTDLYAPKTSAYFKEFKGRIYYTFNDGTSKVLMASDGTAAGTVKLTAENISVSGQLTAVNDKLFFVANDGTTGNELWSTDGTPAGTKLIKDINPGSGGGISFVVGAIGSNLLFAAHNGSYVSELWKTDGTAEGTSVLKSIRPSTGYLLGGKLYFFASSSLGDEPWVSDGTEEGTMLLKDIRPGFPSSSEGSGTTREFIEYNSKVYFFATNATNADVLYETNGTEAGTLPAVNIYAGGGSRARGMVVFNNKLYVSAYVGYQPSERFALVSTDGTQAGTTIIDTLFSANDVGFNHLTVFKNELYMRDNHPTYGHELFKLVGNEIKLVKDIYTGQTYNGGLNYNTYAGLPLFFIYDDALFFLANVNSTDMQVFKSDGTEAGTVQIPNPKASAGSFLRNMVASSIGLYIINYHLDFGAELFKYNSALLNSEKTLAGDNFVISPNPTRSTLNISSSIGFDWIEISDVLGKLRETQMYQENIDLSKLESGVYFIKLKGKDKIYQAKFIKE